MQAPPNEQVRAGQIARGAIVLARQLCAKAIEGQRLDREIREYIHDQGGKPALVGYMPSFAKKPYEWAICLGIDYDVVHGIPIKLVCPGHLVTVDLVVEYKGWYADHARTFTYSDDKTKLNFAIESGRIFKAALEMIIPGQSMNIYSQFIEEAAAMHNYGVVNEYCGHAIGEQIHDHPQVFNKPHPSQGIFEVGRSYAVEPVLAFNENYNLNTDIYDGFSVRADCLASHNEDTVFVGPHGIVNLTGKES